MPFADPLAPRSDEIMAAKTWMVEFKMQELANFAWAFASVNQFADELFTALDRLRREDMTIVLVEQNFRFAAPLADRHLVMEHGRIIETIEARDLDARREHLNSLLGV